MNLFRKKKYVELSHTKDMKVCPESGEHQRLPAWERIAITADENTFVEMGTDLKTENVLSFPNYEDKLDSLIEKLDINEAVTVGECKIGGNSAVLGVMDSRFIMGSMGHVVGERLALAFEYAVNKKLPVIIFTASGGARMQEGIISLMQMAKVSAAVKKHSDAGLLYVTVLTDPTTGGVTASFAMLGDIILSEPKALVGFAGRRVIEQTIRQKLPDEFQTAEFMLKKGFIDRIVDRRDMKKTLTDILNMHGKWQVGSAVDVASAPQGNLGEKAAGIDASPMDAVLIARKEKRPTALAFINYIFDGFLELSGDRYFGDDPAIVGGIATLNGNPVTVLGTQKGNAIEENIKRNFGQPNPEGYRKALRLMKQAEKFNRPIVVFINTSGAFCGSGAEERGQAEAIASNLYSMSALKTPIISIIAGEGGSGGAIALAVADRVWSFEYSAYSVLSPEGFASILWKDGTRAREAADLMKLTSKDLLNLGIVEEIIPEVAGGCQENFEFSADYVKKMLVRELSSLMKLDVDRLLNDRYNRFRRY